MITLHQFARVWDVPNLSPFCCKVETYLLEAGIDYRVRDAIPPRAPKGKLPWIEDDGTVVADSGLIVEHLRQHHADLDAGLTPQERAVSLAFQRLIEEHLFWVMLWSRWGQDRNWPSNKQAIFGVLPPGVRDLAGAYARRRIRGQIRGHGIGLHGEDELFEMGERNLAALSDQLDGKPFFLGDALTSLDCAAFGLLVNVIRVPIESPLKQAALGLENLVAFCDRVERRCFAQNSASASANSAPVQNSATNV